MLETLLISGLTTLLPSMASGVGRVIDRLAGGAKPVNVDEQVRLMAADTERLKVIADLDKPDGQAAPWVVNLRQSFRYFAALYVLVLFSVVTVTALRTPVPEWIVWNVYGLTSVVVGWLFGERFLLKQPEARGSPMARARPAPAPAADVGDATASGGH